MDFQTVQKFTSNALAIQDAARMRKRVVAVQISGRELYELT